MGWEHRGDRRYYYRKVRRGGRVVSTYVGGGVAADRAARADDAARRAVDARRRDARERRQRARADDAALDEVGEVLSLLTAATLLAAGCHTHKREWRAGHHGA